MTMSTPQSILANAIHAAGIGRRAPGSRPPMPVVPFERCGRVVPAPAIDEAIEVEPIVSEVAAEESGPEQNQTNERAAAVLFAVAERIGLPVDRMLMEQTQVAASGRLVAVAIIVRSLIAEPLDAATIVGITAGAAHVALRDLDPILDRCALPVVHDPVGCIAPLLDALKVDLEPKRWVTVAACISATSAASRISLHDLKSDRRTKGISKARQIVMWMAREFTAWSLPEIGRKLGGKDHTTVLYGARKVAAIAETIEPGPKWGPQEWAEALWAADWRAINRERAG